MKINVKRQILTKSTSELLVIPAEEFISKKQKLKKFIGFNENLVSDLLIPLDLRFNGALSSSLKKFNYVPSASKRQGVIVIEGKKYFNVRFSGLSKDAFSEGFLDLEEWRLLGVDSVKEALKNKNSTISIDLSRVGKKEAISIVEAVIEGALLAEYEFDRYKTNKKDNKFFIKELNLLSPFSLFSSVENAKVKVESSILARDLVNTPARDLTPKDFLKISKKVVGERGNFLTLEVYNEAALKKMKAGCLLSVSIGSSEPPYMLHIKYKPKLRNKNSKKIVLVGKGVTFDSGGLSLKPASSMTTMKCDMAGAAAVLGTMKSLASLGVKHEVHAIIPLVENLINGKATKPGDVVKALNSKTVEILNTDAEGRLILADALSFSKKLKADIVIDLATLTGACIVALGDDITGLYSNSDSLADNLLESSKKSGEKLWRMPLEPSYKKLIKSKIADLQNIGGRSGGSITAALFLQEFVPEGVKWAHLDIAGPAFIEKQNEYLSYGGTGYGVRLLLDFLRSY